MKALIKIVFLSLSIIFCLVSCVVSNIEKIVYPKIKCELQLETGFVKEVKHGYHSDFLSYTRNNTERLFITVGKSGFEVNLPREEYTGNNNFWIEYEVFDSITLEGVHNGLYWKQIKFYKDLKPSIGYDGIPKEKVPEFENYIKSFTCKKK